MAKTKDKGQGNKGLQKFIQFSDVLIIILFCVGMLLFILLTWQKNQKIASPDTFISEVSDMIKKLPGEELPPPEIEPWAQRTEEKFDSATYMTRDSKDLSNEVISGLNTYVDPTINIDIPMPGKETTPITSVSVVPQGSAEGNINIVWTAVKNEDCKYYRIRWWRMSSFKDKNYKNIDVRNKQEPQSDLNEGTVDIDIRQTKYMITGITPNEEYLIDVLSLTIDHAPCTYQESIENAYVANVISPGDEKQMPQPMNFRVDKATLAGVELKWDAIMKVYDPEVHPELTTIKVAIFRWKNGNEDQKELLNPPNEQNTFGTMTNRYEDLSTEPDVPYSYGIQYYHVESYPDWENKEVNYLYDELLELTIQDVNPRTGKAITKDNKPVWVTRKVFASKLIKLPEPIVLKDRPVVVVTSIQGRSNPDNSSSKAKILLTVYKDLPVPEEPQKTKFVRVKVELDVKYGDILKGSTDRPLEIDGEKVTRNSRYGKLLREKNITIDFETSLKVVGIYYIEYKYSTGNTDTIMYVELKNMDPEYADCWPFKVYRKRDIEDAEKIREAEENGPATSEDGEARTERKEGDLRKQALVPNKPEDRQRGLNPEERKEMLKKIIEFAKKHNQDPSTFREKTFKFTKEFEDYLWEFLVENEIRFYTNSFLEGFPILREFDQLRKLVNE